MNIVNPTWEPLPTVVELVGLVVVDEVVSEMLL